MDSKLCLRIKDALQTKYGTDAADTFSTYIQEKQFDENKIKIDIKKNINCCLIVIQLTTKYPNINPIQLFKLLNNVVDNKDLITLKSQRDRINWDIGFRVSIMTSINPWTFHPNPALNSNWHNGIISNIYTDSNQEEWLDVIYYGASITRTQRFYKDVKPINYTQIQNCYSKSKNSLDEYLIKNYVSFHERTLQIIIPGDILNILVLWFAQNTICLLVAIPVKNKLTLRIPVNPTKSFLRIKEYIKETQHIPLNKQVLEITCLKKEVRDYLSPNDYNLHNNSGLQLKIIDRKDTTFFQVV